MLIGVSFSWTVWFLAVLLNGLESPTYVKHKPIDTLISPGM